MEPTTLAPETSAPIRIVRAPKDPAHPYGRLSNAVLTPGPTLPLDSRSVLAYLLSLPDTWHLRLSHLRRVIGCGRDKLQRMIRDLETAGHLVRRRIHSSDGRWWWDSTLYEEPLAPRAAVPGTVGTAATPLARSVAAPASLSTPPAPTPPPLPPMPVAAPPVPPEPVLQEQCTTVTTPLLLHFSLKRHIVPF